MVNVPLNIFVMLFMRVIYSIIINKYLTLFKSVIFLIWINFVKFMDDNLKQKYIFCYICLTIEKIWKIK